jgi:polygalacturonase
MKPSFVFVTICLLITNAAAAAPATQPGRASFNVLEFGATGDGQTNCTKAIQSTIDTAASTGGGTVLVPAGQYVTGTLWMRSNITLQLEPGATLLGSQNKDDFPEWVSKWEGPSVKPRRAAIISGEDLENVAITGRGTIDGRGEMWWEMQRASRGVEVLRPLTYRLINCRNILVEGITVRRSPMWTISPLACDNVTISKLTIINPPDSPNTDGINPESCRNVHIDSCHVDVGDDCITIKSGKETDGRRELWPSENITITNCTLLHGHGGVVFGSEMSGSIRNVTISNCVFVGTDRGLRFKSRRGRGGVVEDIRADNLVMDGVLCPIVVNLFYAPGAPRDDRRITDQSPFPVDDTTPRFRRLRFSNITARNVKYAAAYIMGLPEMPVEDIVCENLSLLLDPKNTQAGAGDMAPGSEKILRGGFLAQRVKGLTLRNVDVTDQLGPAVSLTDAADVILSDLSLRSAQANAPMIQLDQVRGASVRGCSVPRDTATALRVVGERTTDLRVGENDFTKAQRPVEIAPNVNADAVSVARQGLGSSLR